MRYILGCFLAGIGAQFMNWGMKIGGDDVRGIIREAFKL